jgi:hypothetical protein
MSLKTRASLIQDQLSCDQFTPIIPWQPRFCVLGLIIFAQLVLLLLQQAEAG